MRMATPAPLKAAPHRAEIRMKKRFHSRGPLMLDERIGQ